MNILVLNCGSSSIKYQLFDMREETVLAKGIVEKIGLKGSFLLNERHDGDKVRLEGEVLDAQAAIEYVLGVLLSPNHGSLRSMDQIQAVGHRVVHGGEAFQASVLIDQRVMADIERCIELAPLHNPANLKGIEAIASMIPKVPQVAVFDTAFHQSMPPRAYMYATPYSLYKKYGIRRYGFHGTSHRYVSEKAAEFLGRPLESLKLITAHLGNGASMSAIQNGKSVDTSMGLTPVEGLVMGTRSGDLDLGVLTFLMDKEELSLQSANSIINKHSGMLGISGISSDMREIEAAADQDNRRARLALDVYAYRARKYIGSYIAAMNGLDALVFTGGVGENSRTIRRLICQEMDYLGLEMDTERNQANPKPGDVATPASRARILIMPTNEELVIARDTLAIVGAADA